MKKYLQNKNYKFLNSKYLRGLGTGVYASIYTYTCGEFLLSLKISKTLTML